MEKPSLLRRRLLFASLSLLAAFAVAGGAWADTAAGLSGVAETGVKLLLILALCALLLTQKAPSAPRSRSVPARSALWGLLPPAVVLSHALTNALSQTIALCTAGESHPYLGAAADAVSILGMAALAAAGLGMLFRGNLLAFRKEAAA